MADNAAFIAARARYARWGADVESAMARLKDVPLSIPCWQGDDVTGFEARDGGLTGGIQATGGYPGRARNFNELTRDFMAAAALIPGPKRLSLHASYAVFENGEQADRDALAPRHFKAWADWSRRAGIPLDFNPTFFSHPKAAGLTLSSPDEAIRAFWVRHGIQSRRIAQYLSEQQGSPCLNNVWIPDGLKDIPADRLGPRRRLWNSLDQIFAEKLPGVIDCVESKVFGIGLEAYTVGSGEFYMGYALRNPGVYNLLDSGHYHPTESISDKLSALMCCFDRLPLHITRAVRWDSDHVVRFDDETRAIALELVRCGALDKALIGLDFFDASVNRVAAWVIGARSMQKALLLALLEPSLRFTQWQNEGRFTELLMAQEEAKTLPFGAVWEEYCRRAGVPGDESWFKTVAEYERNVLFERK